MKLIPKKQRLSKRILVNVSPTDKQRLTNYCRHFNIPVSFFLRYEGLRTVYLTSKDKRKCN